MKFQRNKNNKLPLKTGVFHLDFSLRFRYIDIRFLLCYHFITVYTLLLLLLLLVLLLSLFLYFLLLLFFFAVTVYTIFIRISNRL